MIACDKTTFETEVLQEKTPVLVDFYGDTCAPCAALMPHVEKLEEIYGDKIKFCKLNTSSARRLAISQGIMGLPVIAVYQDGKKAEELIKDDATPENIEAMLKRYV